MRARNAAFGLRRLAAASLAALACSAAPARGEVESRGVADFDEVVLEVAGDLRIEQGPREALTLEAEPAVLRMITTEVRQRRLRIGLAPGRVETRQPIRMTLSLRKIRSFESRAAGAVSAGPLQAASLALTLGGGGSIRVARVLAQTLEVRIAGAGDVAIGGGHVKAQRVAITGIGGYAAPAMDSERAEVAIDGNGQARLAAAGTLDVRIGGVGQVHYRGEPALTQSIRGIGSVERD